MKNKISFYIPFILLFLLSIPGNAQTLKGRIIEANSSQTPIEFATVCLYNNEKKIVLSSQTDKNGEFVFHVDKLQLKEVYELHVLYIGYQSIIMKISLSERDMNLGTLTMKEGTKILDEVVVNSNGKVMADGYTIFPSKLAQTQSTTGYDFLRKLMLPDIKVEQNARKIQTVTGDEVLVLINGKKASVEELLTLRTHLIKKVEYIDAPGAEFSAEKYGAVIKILVTQPESGVQGGFNFVNSVTTPAGENFAFIRYNHKLSEIGLTLENSYTHIQRRSVSQYDHYKINNTEDITIKRIGLDKPLYYLNNKATIYFNHTLPEKHIFNVAISNIFYDSPKRTSAQQVIESGCTPYLSISNPTEKYHSPEVDIFYLQALKQGATLSYNAHLTYISTDYGYHYSESHPIQGERTYGYNTKGDKYSLINEIRYEQKIKAMYLKIGGRYLYGQTKNKYIGVEKLETKLQNHDLYLYSQISGNLNKLRYSLGMGVNYIETQQFNKIASSWIIRPRLSLTLPIKTWDIQYNMSVDPVTPSLAMLSDVSQQANVWDLITGNPQLKAFHLLKNWATIRKRFGKRIFTSTRFGLEYGNKPIIETIERIKNNGQICFRHSYANDGTQLQTWAMTGIQWQIIPENFTITGMLSYNYYHNSNKYFTHHLHRLNLSLEADLTIGRWNFMAGYSSGQKQLEGEILTEDSPNINTSVRYHLGNWVFGLNATNIFQSYGKRRQVELLNKYRSYQQDLHIPSMSNMIGISVSWQFTTGRKYNAGRPNIDNKDTDSGIVKF